MSIENRLIWIDMEMTGLDPETDKVLEIAAIVTDDQLNVIAEMAPIAVYQPDSVLDNMGEWCTETHGKSGLTERCRESKVLVSTAERMTLDFLSEHTLEGTSPLCGNSVSQDRRFMYKHMPILQSYFHYRTIDVSTIKELVRRWNPDLPAYNKSEKHLALDDIRESLGELAYYRQHVFSI